MDINCTDHPVIYDDPYLTYTVTYNNKEIESVDNVDYKIIFRDVILFFAHRDIAIYMGYTAGDLVSSNYYSVTNTFLYASRHHGSFHEFDIALGYHPPSFISFVMGSREASDIESFLIGMYSELLPWNKTSKNERVKSSFRPYRPAVLYLKVDLAGTFHKDININRFSKLPLNISKFGFSHSISTEVGENILMRTLDMSFFSSSLTFSKGLVKGDELYHRGLKSRGLGSLLGMVELIDIGGVGKPIIILLVGSGIKILVSPNKDLEAYTQIMRFFNSSDSDRFFYSPLKLTNEGLSKFSSDEVSRMESLYQ